MKGSLNTIRKQTLLFNYNGKADGFALQKEVSDWCNFTLIPEIERQLDFINLGENYLEIDKLEIEASVDSTDWQQKINDELIFSLKQKLSDYKPTLSEITEEIATKKAKLDDLILFYFENGYMPWWGKALLDDDFKTVFRNWILEDLSVGRAEFIQVQLERIISKNVVERIINQVPQKLFFRFLRNIYRRSSEILSQFESFFEELILKNLSPENEKFIVKAVYGHVLKIAVKSQGQIESDSILPFLYRELKAIPVSGKILKPQPVETKKSPNPLKGAWQELLIGESKKKKIESETEKQATVKNFQEESEPEEITHEKQLQYSKLIDRLLNPDLEQIDKDELVAELQEGIFIDNAGAVIFAAFIPALFKKLELENDGKIVKPDLAALIVQFCVSGKIQIDEYDLVLPKILCGLDIEYPVNTNLVLTEEQLTEANEMLQALIEYWSVLKDTSVEGLRESFFKRSGKLSMVNNEWVLVVDQRPYDMLLERLPWSISMIKLPWMKNLLKTEWV